MPGRLDEWLASLGAPAGSDDLTHSRSSFSASASFVSGGTQKEVHSGWMKKKGQGGLFGAKMQKRYFVLYDNRELHYFEGTSVENIVRKGRIILATATAVVRCKPSDKKDFSFMIKVPDRDWTLDPGTEAAWEEWKAQLDQMLG